MRIIYQSGKLYLSLTKDEYKDLKDGVPNEIDLFWLPHLLKDISEANYQRLKDFTKND
jgi:hypothetical protein